MKISAALGYLKENPSLSLDLIRIYLGGALAVRGFLMVADNSSLLAFLGEEDRNWFFPTAAVHYVSLTHLGGGILLALGFLTRFAVLLQIPILGGALFFVHLRDGLLAPGQSLELSALVLFLLLVILAFGPGKLSADFLLGGEAGTGRVGITQGGRLQPISPAGIISRGRPSMSPPP
jgi:putative oxidoreductase